MTIFAPAARRGLFVDWAFFDGSEISSEFVGGQCASWRLPPKAAVSACSRHSFVEGIRNGGLDVLKTAAVLENPLWAHEATCPATVFFFPVLRGQDRLSYWFSCSCSATSFSREKLSSLMMCSIRQASASAVLGSTPAAISCSVKSSVARRFFRQPRSLHRSDGESDLRP